MAEYKTGPFYTLLEVLAVAAAVHRLGDWVYTSGSDRKNGLLTTSEHIEAMFAGEEPFPNLIDDDIRIAQEAHTWFSSLPVPNPPDDRNTTYREELRIQYDTYSDGIQAWKAGFLSHVVPLYISRMT